MDEVLDRTVDHARLARPKNHNAHVRWGGPFVRRMLLLLLREPERLNGDGFVLVDRFELGAWPR